MLDLNIDISIQVLIKRILWRFLVVCVTLKDYYHVVGFHIKTTKSNETSIFLTVTHMEKFVSSLNEKNHLPYVKDWMKNVYVDFFYFEFLCNAFAASKNFKDDALMVRCERIVDFLNFSGSGAWWRSNSNKV